MVTGLLGLGHDSFAPLLILFELDSLKITFPHIQIDGAVWFSRFPPQFLPFKADTIERLRFIRPAGRCGIIEKLDPVIVDDLTTFAPGVPGQTSMAGWMYIPSLHGITNTKGWHDVRIYPLCFR